MLCPATTQGWQRWPVSVASGCPAGWLDVAANQRLGRAAEALFRDWLCIYCLLLHEDFVLSPCARKIMTFNRLFSNKLCCKTSTLLEFQIVEAHHYHRHIGCCCRRNCKLCTKHTFSKSSTTSKSCPTKCCCCCPTECCCCSTESTWQS